MGTNFGSHNDNNPDPHAWANPNPTGSPNYFDPHVNYQPDPTSYQPDPTSYQPFPPTNVPPMNIPPTSYPMGYGTDYRFSDIPLIKPDNYQIWAILTTLFCFIPTGAVSIYYSIQVDRLWNKGDVYGSTEASRKARLWAMISMGIMLIWWVFTFISLLLVIMMVL